MKTPDGTIDVIGSSLEIGATILGLIKDNMPTKQERKVNIGLRRLKHRFKNVPIEVYVKANFDDCTEERQIEIINLYKGVLQRD